MRRLKQVWLFEDTINFLDSNNNGTSRARFADEIINYGILHKKEIFLEIIPEKKWGRPKKR